MLLAGWACCTTSGTPPFRSALTYCTPLPSTAVCTADDDGTPQAQQQRQQQPGRKAGGGASSGASDGADGGTDVDTAAAAACRAAVEQLLADRFSPRGRLVRRQLPGAAAAARAALRRRGWRVLRLGTREVLAAAAAPVPRGRRAPRAADAEAARAGLQALLKERLAVATARVP